MEIWKNIKESIYEISNEGRIRNNLTLRVLKTFTCGRGYKSVKIKVSGYRRNFYLHRLVAIAFIPNPEDKPEVDHIDRDPTNNNYINLRWVNKIENNSNRLFRGTNKLRINRETIEKIVQLNNAGLSTSEILIELKKPTRY